MSHLSICSSCFSTSSSPRRKFLGYLRKAAWSATFQNKIFNGNDNDGERDPVCVAFSECRGVGGVPIQEGGREQQPPQT